MQLLKRTFTSINISIKSLRARHSQTQLTLQSLRKQKMRLLFDQTSKKPTTSECQKPITALHDDALLSDLSKHSGGARTVTVLKSFCPVNDGQITVKWFTDNLKCTQHTTPPITFSTYLLTLSHFPITIEKKHSKNKKKYQ